MTTPLRRCSRAETFTDSIIESERAVARLVVRRLAEQRTAGGDPVRDPFDHRLHRRVGVTDQLPHAIGATEQRVGGFATLEARRDTESLTEYRREIAHPKRARA